MSALDLSSVTAAMEAVKAERARLENAIEAAKRERETLSAQPLCKADVLAVLHAQLDRDAAAALERLEGVVKFIATHPLKTFDKVHVLSYGPNLVQDPGGSLLALQGLLADQIKEAVTAALALRPEVPGCGAPIAARKARIAVLDAQIAADEAALTELRATAKAAGFNLTQSVF